MMIHWDEMMRCVGQLLARAFFVALVTPFLIVFGACAYALAASQAQHFTGPATSGYVGAAAAVAFGCAAFYVLGWWLVTVDKQFSSDMSEDNDVT